ncbi:MAG: KH domain-containing protein [Cellulosilyticaceae bacterium]
MKQLVEVIAKELVDYPEAVTVSEKQTQGTIVLELKVAQEDMGKIIGKQGKIAKAIRTIVKSAAVSSDKKVVVEIMQ